MTRISSKWIFFYKRVFPALWYGFLVFFVCMNFFAFSHSARQVPAFTQVIVGLTVVFMGGFGGWLMKRLIFELADEVYDGGDFLLIKRGKDEERVSFAEIMNVSYSVLVNPPRVTLNLRSPGRFGKDVSFCPLVRPKPFAKSPLVESLIQRIDASRAARN